MAIRPRILDFGQTSLQTSFFGRRKTYFYAAQHSGETPVLNCLKDYRIKYYPRQFHETGSISAQSILIVYKPEAHFSDGQEFQDNFLSEVDLASTKMILVTEDSSYTPFARHQNVYLLSNIQQVNELCRLHNQLKAGCYN
jgi:hypothetical protein